MEWRRGLSQVGNITSMGLFGNNTDLASDVFLKNDDLVPILGHWFNPGILSLIWDDETILGTISTDIMVLLTQPFKCQLQLLDNMYLL